MNHARYGAYKDSGVEWIDKIPDTWNLLHLKNCVSKKITDGPHATPVFIDDGVPFLSAEAVQDGGLNFSSKRGYISEADDKIYSLKCKPKRNDIFIVKSGSTTGKIGYVSTDENFNIWSPLALVRSGENFDPRYVFLFLSSSYFQQQVQMFWSFGTQPNIGMGVIEALQIAVPPHDEQQAIAVYLDSKTAQLDRKIHLLDQKAAQYGKLKQSLINETVTRGLDKTVEMKDSGVEWLGEVPAHWEVQRIKDITLVKRGASPRPIDDPIFFNEEGEYSWVRIADLSASERYLLNTKEKLSSLGASLSVKRYPGDFILSIAGTVGKPIITRIKCCIHDGFVWFPTLKMNPEFLYYIFSTGLPYQGLGKLGTQLNLNTETVGLISIPLPSASEIENIVAYLDAKTAHIDRIVATLNTQIDRLKELRKTLINDIVTGKICIFKQEANHE